MCCYNDMTLLNSILCHKTIKGYKILYKDYYYCSLYQNYKWKYGENIAFDCEEHFIHKHATEVCEGFHFYLLKEYADFALSELTNLSDRYLIVEFNVETKYIIAAGDDGSDTNTFVASRVNFPGGPVPS